MKITKSQLKRIIKEEVLKLVEGDVIKFPGSKKPSATALAGEDDAEVVSIANRRKQKELSTVNFGDADAEEVEATLRKFVSDWPAINKTFEALNKAGITKDLSVDSLTPAQWMPFLKAMWPRVDDASKDPNIPHDVSGWTRRLPGRKNLEEAIMEITVEVLDEIGVIDLEGLRS